MMYSLRYSKKFKKGLAKIDKKQAKLIVKWLKIHVNNCADPKSIGRYKELQGDLKGFFRYRIGSYRIICKLFEDKLVILAIEIGHRKDIYK